MEVIDANQKKIPLKYIVDNVILPYKTIDMRFN
jgi:hypothetical protein